MPKKHISQQRVSSDVPEYLLPPHPSEKNSQRPPLPAAALLPELPSHIKSNPRHLPPTAGATADGLVTPDHVSLQEFCPALSQRLQGQRGSSRSTSAADPARRCADLHRTCRRELRKKIKQNKKALLSLAHQGKTSGKGKKNPNQPTFMQCNCPHSSYQFLLGVLMGAHICPPPSLLPSSILASAGDA